MARYTTGMVAMFMPWNIVVTTTAPRRMIDRPYAAYLDNENGLIQSPIAPAISAMPMKYMNQIGRWTAENPATAAGSAVILVSPESKKAKLISVKRVQ